MITAAQRQALAKGLRLIEAHAREAATFVERPARESALTLGNVRVLVVGIREAAADIVEAIDLAAGAGAALGWVDQRTGANVVPLRPRHKKPR